MARDGAEIGTVPIEDLGVLVVDHQACSYTHGALTALAENNVAVVVCGPNHHPAALLLPAEGYSLQAESICRAGRRERGGPQPALEGDRPRQDKRAGDLLERLKLEAGGLTET